MRWKANERGEERNSRKWRRLQRGVEMGQGSGLEYGVMEEGVLRRRSEGGLRRERMEIGRKEIGREREQELDRSGGVRRGTGGEDEREGKCKWR